MTPAEGFEVFGELRRQEEERERELVRLVAELEVLERFDWLRQAAGHDYGAGQRANELMRRRRELDRDARRACSELEELEPTPARLEAFERIGRPRAWRIIHPEAYRATTPASKRTLATWREVAAELGLELQGGQA